MADFPKADDLFRPIGAVQREHSRLFAGRSDIVDAILSGLELSGAVPIVFGERGVGKSSAAWRVFDILREKDVNEDYGKIAAEFDLDEHYIPLWVECGDWFSGIESALLALLLPSGLRQAVTIPDQFPDFLSETDRTKAEASFELNLALFKAKTSLSGAESRDALARALRAGTQAALADPIEMFSQVCGRLLEQYRDSTLVVFIDEFDRLPDNALVGSVLKTFTKVRFVVVGVAKTAETLIGSHPSVGRKLVGIEVPPFERSETEEVFRKATEVSESYPDSKGLQFSNAYVDRVHHDTGGYPNLIQKIGFHTIKPDRLHREMFKHRVDIGLEHYKPALKAMFKPSKNRAASEEEVERRISEAVGDSDRRLMILRALVACGMKWVGFSDLAGQLEKPYRTQLVGNLKIFLDAGVVASRGDDEYRFSSPIYLMVAQLYLESL